MSESAQEQVRFKRKRKKNFLRNAKGYGKKGMYGRGTQLDSETYQYFIRILEVYKEGFSTDEEKAIFVNNVFQHTEGQEINCCCNQVGCRVIQTFLPFANDTHLERYMNILLTDLRPLCCDPFASHVLQTLMDIACQKSLEKHTDSKFQDYCKTTTVKISKFLLNNLEDYIWDNYGNHIIRTVLKNLACVGNDTCEPINEYKGIVKDYGVRLISWPQFNDLPYSEITSGLLQVLLCALAKIDVKLLKTYLEKFLSDSFTKISIIESESTSANVLPDAFMSKSMIMLLESCLEVATPELYSKIYTQCFVQKLVQLSKMRNTNFAVQKLVNQCKEKSEFEAMFDELSNSFSEIIDVGHTGVILALGQACKRLSSKQGVFVQNILKYYDCYESETNQLDIVMCLCKNLKHGVLKENQNVDLQNMKLNLHGTLIVQLILEFNKPIKIINSILNIDTYELKKLFCNRMGSYIVDSYVNSQYVGEKSREKLIRKLQGTYQDLASDKYGSRSFEALWKVANMKNRKGIMNELAHKDGVWSNTQFGKIISNKIHLEVYKRNKEDWNNCIAKKESQVTPKELFADIIGK